MGKKRKSGDSEVQDGATGKRKTSISAAQLSQSSKSAVALPANSAVKKGGKKGGGSGNQEKGGTNCSEALNGQKSKDSAIDAMFGALKSAKKRAEPVVATETLPNDEMVRS